MDMFARDYKIEVAADNKDCVFWRMIRKGETVSPSAEDKIMAVTMLRKVLTMLENSLKYNAQASNSLDEFIDGMRG